ncbi:MAG TPA: NnrU family protein [Alphaproteobacteria bacterium]|nr:NnrU family protein [Alphaproteobacteria bacterium]
MAPSQGVTALIATALLLFASHGVLSAPGIRPALIGRFGRGGFQALHATASTATFVAFLRAYAAFDANRQLYAPLPGSGPMAVLLMPIAFFLVTARVMTPFGEAAALSPPHGIYSVTRHPGSIGLLIWAGLHLAATGDLKRVIFFATMGAIALFAIAKNEWVLRQGNEKGHRSFLESSSLIPFMALVSRGPHSAAAGIGWPIPAAAFLAYTAMLLLHPVLFGIDPLDWLP